MNIARWCPGQFAGDPINLTTGNRVHIDTDYVGAGPFPLVFSRTYNSQSTTDWRLGKNWSHSYSAQIQPVRILHVMIPGQVLVIRPDGRRLTFTGIPPLNVKWVSSPDTNSILEKLPDGGWRYTTGSDEVETYDATGKLRTITTREGLIQDLVYDGELLVKVTDLTDPSLKRTLTFAYDESNRISKITDPAGGIFSYDYDSKGNLEFVTGPDKPERKTRRYHYENTDFPHELTGVTDENNARFATFKYGVDRENRRAESSELAGGADKVLVAYDADRATHVIDALRTERSYEYETKFGSKRTSKATKPSSVGGTTSSTWTYDGNGNIASYTDYLGHTTSFIYNSRNLETSRTEALGTPRQRTITTEWHPTFRMPTKITEPDRVTDFDYQPDEARRCGLTPEMNLRLCSLTVTDTSGRGTGSPNRTWNLAYDDDGQIGHIEGPRTDDITTYKYDAQGNLESVSDAAGHVTRFRRYDEHGRPREIEDPNGLITTLEYDERGRLKSEQAGSEKTEYEYDGTGQLVELRRPDGRSFSFTYDPAHRLTRVTDNLGNTITYTLDLVGNAVLEEVRDSAGNLVRTNSRTFDALNRLASSVGREAHTTSFEYDDNDNLVKITDPLGVSNTTPWVYDELDRLTTSVDLNQGEIGYRYDAGDRLKALVDPIRLETSYGYDGLDNLTSSSSPDTGHTTYVPDEAGNVVSRTDARGKLTEYDYDALNRVTDIRYPDLFDEPGMVPSGFVRFIYDGETNDPGNMQNVRGRLTEMTDVTGTTRWDYDQHGRVTRKSQQMASIADPFVTQYHYGPTSGRLDAITYPSGQIVRFIYADGQITWIGARGDLLTNIEHEPFGPPKSWVLTDLGRTLHSREFDLEGRVKAYDLGGGRATEIKYDRSGRIANYIDTDPTRDQEFVYDAAGRLLGFTGASTILDLDDNGNRESDRADGYTRDPGSNQLLSVEGSIGRTYEYDAAGNITSDGINRFDYDGRGRLIRATNKNGSKQYLINGLGQRVAKLDCPEPSTADCGVSRRTGSYFVHDEAGRLLGEYDHRGVRVQEFVYLDDMLVAVLMHEGRFIVYPDHLGTPRAIAEDAFNEVVWRWDSDPFGVGAPDEDPDGDGQPFTFNLRFPGQYFDEETGLFHNYFRDYDPQTGRYIQPDPIGLAGGINPYLYAEGNPLSSFDPYGFAPVFAGVSTVPSSGLGPNVPPQRVHGPWTLRDLFRAEWGLPPKDFTSNRKPLELHHGDQMPGSGVHEVPPGQHRLPGMHPNRYNQGVTPAMRKADRNLHWQYRGQEMWGGRASRAPSWVLIGWDLLGGPFWRSIGTERSFLEQWKKEYQERQEEEEWRRFSWRLYYRHPELGKPPCPLPDLP